MFKSVSEYLRTKTASKVIVARMLPGIGIDLDEDADPACAREVCNCVARQPINLIRDCCIKTLGFEDLGPTAKYYPNHGYYRPSDEVLNLNTRMLDDPVFGVSSDGRPISKFEFILAHELGHGWDAAQGLNRTGKDYSLCPEWLELSDWSETPRPGHKRLRIRERGYPEKVGEWYYGPKASFPRYYGKMNPWDDWADGFAYYVTGMKDKLPKEKFNYFNERLGSYFQEPSIDLSLEQYAPRYAFDTSSDPADHPKVPQSLVKYKEKYPELFYKIVLHTVPKKVTGPKTTFGVKVPDLKTYMSMATHIDSFLRSNLGYVPEFDRSGKSDSLFIDEIEDIFEKYEEQPKPSMSIEKTPSTLLNKFFRGKSAMSYDYSEIVFRLKKMASTLDDRGLIMQAAELRSASKKIAADVKEVFRVNVGPEQITVKSFEQFFEDSSEEDLIEALQDYERYIGSIYESYKDKVKDEKAFKEVFTESLPNIIKMAIQSYKKPIPGRVFKDPIHPTVDEIEHFVRVIIDRNLKNTLNRLKSRV